MSQFLMKLGLKIIVKDWEQKISPQQKSQLASDHLQLYHTNSLGIKNIDPLR
jgi:hypothetical protein